MDFSPLLLSPGIDTQIIRHRSSGVQTRLLKPIDKAVIRHWLRMKLTYLLSHTHRFNDHFTGESVLGS